MLETHIAHPTTDPHLGEHAKNFINHVAGVPKKGFEMIKEAGAALWEVVKTVRDGVGAVFSGIGNIFSKWFGLKDDGASHLPHGSPANDNATAHLPHGTPANDNAHGDHASHDEHGNGDSVDAHGAKAVAHVHEAAAQAHEAAAEEHHDAAHDAAPHTNLTKLPKGHVANDNAHAHAA